VLLLQVAHGGQSAENGGHGERARQGVGAAPRGHVHHDGVEEPPEPNREPRRRLAVRSRRPGRLGAATTSAAEGALGVRVGFFQEEQDTVHERAGCHIHGRKENLGSRTVCYVVQSAQPREQRRVSKRGACVGRGALKHEGAGVSKHVIVYVRVGGRRV